MEKIDIITLDLCTGLLPLLTDLLQSEMERWVISLLIQGSILNASCWTNALYWTINIVKRKNEVIVTWFKKCSFHVFSVIRTSITVAIRTRFPWQWGGTTIFG